MKKLFVLVLVSCITVTSAFAQFRFSFTTNYSIYAFSTLIPTGMAAQRTMINDDGVEVANIGTNRLDPMWLIRASEGRQGFYVPSGGFGLFTPRVSSQSLTFDDLDGTFISPLDNMELHVTYERGMLTLSCSFYFRDFFLQRKFNSIEEPLFSAFRAPIDFRLRFAHPLFNFTLGENVARAVDEYRDFTDWSMHVHNYGVLLPGDDRFIFRTVPDRMGYKFNPVNPISISQNIFGILTLKFLEFRFFLPLHIDLGIDFNTGSITGISEAAQRRVNLFSALRGRRIGGFLNFDLEYQMRGGDGNLDDSWDEILNPGGGFQPDGRGAMSHYFSFIFGLPDLIPNLGIGLGYFALFSRYEDLSPRPDEDFPLITTTGPLYSGIELRLRYTGIPGLRLTMYNNISFANASEPEIFFDSVAGDWQVSGVSKGINGQLLNPFRSQSWFAMHNAFAAEYAINSRLSTRLEVIHRMAVITDRNSNDSRGGGINDWGTSVRVNNHLKCALYLVFNLTREVYLNAGAIVIVDKRRTTFNDYLSKTFSGPTRWETGVIGIGIPLLVGVRW